MSIHTEAAVQALNKEIERLTSIRDSLLVTTTKGPKPSTEVTVPAKRAYKKRVSAAKKAATRTPAKPEPKTTK